MRTLPSMLLRRARTAEWVLLAAVLAGCSHQDRCAKVEVEVVGDPAHTAKVSPEAVKRGEAVTYRVGGSDHDHAVSLTSEDMKKLQSGDTVTVRTSSASAHVHDVIVRCKN